jgi:hypothetical protein
LIGCSIQELLGLIIYFCKAKSGERRKKGASGGNWQFEKQHVRNTGGDYYCIQGE